MHQDAKIVKIVLTNLLYNAIKYSEEDIQIEIDADTKNIKFKIEDKGIGIPENEQNLIFQRLFRAKNAVYFPGTGIGLNIVKGYVEKLKGTISFESIERKGTIFNITLPKINCDI